MKKNILFALISLCLWACSEDEIKPYQGEQYLYFSQLINTTNDYDKENGYMEVSFNNYPPSVEYLEEHYGIQIDRERYNVFYSGFASNIMPDITVIPAKGGEDSEWQP